MVNKQQDIKKEQTEEFNISSDKQRLDDLSIELKEKASQLKEREGQLQQREQICIKREKALEERVLELSKRHQAQELRQLEIEKNLPTLRDQLFKEREDELVKQKEELKQQRFELDKQLQKFKDDREALVRIQKKVDGDFAAERVELQQELFNMRDNAQKELAAEIQKQRDISFKKIEDELQERRDELDSLEENFIDEVKQLTKDRSSVTIEQAQVDSLKASLEQKIAEGIKARHQEFEQAQQQFERQNKRLLDRIDSQTELFSLYDQLQKELGDLPPEKILLELTNKNEELKKLREKLIEPTAEVEAYYDAHRAEVAKLEKDNQRLQDEKLEIQRQLNAQEQLEYEQYQLETKYDSLEVRYESIIADNNKLKETLKRVSPAYKDPVSIKERLKNIKRPYIQKYVPRRQEKNINELEWLDAIRLGIAEYGLQFSERILCAFHTALKIAEWSPLTVLAGVSGTGKSELPKLYSHFGGINFINVPVQPNWDSQESMLGYFNSISNSYEAQPMLNFLVQSREKLVTGSENPEDDYNGLDDTVSLVLLDEMNLAHVELYFADFLSKLEQRRGAKKNELPHIDINLGSDMEPYKLSLGRNLLFTGTMNQDETTKSLSDKVIDRGTSIFFPRPNSLHSRKKLKGLPEQEDLLPMHTWWHWIAKESSLSDEMVKRYKQLIEKINECLGADGKALGHRVWQSIEYYMVNHPLVLGLDQSQYPDEYKEALKFAFEDQLVQKVMPKLRGIETRGYAKEYCLDPIRDLLAAEKLDILDDFDRAMRIGHGQFNWVSADYLNNEQSNERYEELFKLAMMLPEQEHTQGV